MTEANDPNRADQKDVQPVDAANTNDNRQDAAENATAPPTDERKLAEESETEKSALETSARENLERVGVDAEHKTEAMRKHQRGTFP